jgi:arabinogalactan oligomer / maltooligosaccharide transport system substrate-binding protein
MEGRSSVRGRGRYRQLSWDQAGDEPGPSFGRRQRRPPWLLAVVLVLAAGLVFTLRNLLVHVPQPAAVRPLSTALAQATPVLQATGGTSLSVARSPLPVPSVVVGSLGAVTSTTASMVTPARSDESLPGLLSPLSPVSTAITITYWEQEADEGAALLDQLAGDFMHANPGIQVQRVHLRSSNQLQEEFSDLAVTGRGPELARGANDLATGFLASGALQPAGHLFDAAFLAQFFPGALSSTVVSGTLWAVPDNYGGQLMLLYNKKLVTEVPASTGAWIDQLKTLSDDGKGHYGLVYNLNEPYWLIPWIAGFGGWPLDASDHPDLYNQAVVDALAFVHDLKYVQHVLPPEATYDRAAELFRAGNAAYLIDGPWNFDSYRAAGMEVGIALLPRVSQTGLEPVPLTTSTDWFFNRNLSGLRLEAARRFVAYMTGEAAQTMWLEKLGRLPSNRQIAQRDVVQSDSLLFGQLQQLARGRGVSPAPAMLCVLQAMRPGLEGVMADAISPTDAALQMEQGAKACMTGGS